MFDNNSREYRQPVYNGDLALSLRKVSNGYSVKINHSNIDEDVGRIIVAPNKAQVLVIIAEILDTSDAAGK